MTAAEVFETHGPAETEALGRKLAARFDAGDCVALVGDLGAGKTVLVRGLALGLGLTDPRLVSSPTFVLVQEYPARVPVYHLDLYRMTDAAAELVDLGFDEMLSTGVVIVEWADRAAGVLPRRHWRIDIGIVGETQRRFTLSRVGEE